MKVEGCDFSKSEQGKKRMRVKEILQTKEGFKGFHPLIPLLPKSKVLGKEYKILGDLFLLGFHLGLSMFDPISEHDMNLTRVFAG